jgi:diguanylate cyclase (GGDEF)-like protein
MWFGTEDGLNRFDGFAFSVFRRDPADPASLSHNFVWAVEEDAQGGLWVGTEGGLNRRAPGTSAFTRLRHDPRDETTVGADFIWALLADRNGAIWVGTKGGGLSRYDPATRVFKRYRHDATRADSLPQDDVRALLESRSGAIWVGTLGGLARLDPESGRFTCYRRTAGDDGSLPDDEVRSLHEDAQGRLWVGTTKGGLARFVEGTGRFVRYPAEPGRAGALGKGMIRAIGGDGRGALWVGTDDGLDLWRPEAQSFLAFRHDAARPFSLSDDSISAIYSDRGGVLWIGTRAAGLNRWNPSSGVFTSATNDNGVWRTPLAYAAYALVISAALVAWQRSQQRRLAREAEYSHRLEREVQERTAELAASNRELQDANRRFEEASLTDALTGLHNRRYLLAEIEGDLALAERQRLDEPEHSSSCLFLMEDLDGFKQLNDAHGHRAGDEALRQVTALLREACRRSDVIIRWGGDEFLVLGRETDRAGGAVLAERIVSAVAAHAFQIEGVEPQRLSCSVGYAFHPFVTGDPDSISWEQVLVVADRALYAAKASGRNAWVGLEEGPRATAGDVLGELARGPEDAVARGLVRVQSSLGPERRLAWRSEA